MASSVSAALLKQLSAVSQTINDASDELNEQIRTIEAALASYNLGVSAWVRVRDVPQREYSNGQLTEYTQTESLGYDRHKGKWCLRVGAWCPEFERDLGDWVLLDAPREMRMYALEAIPQLLEKLFLEASKLASEVAGRAARAKMIAESVKPKKGQ